MVFNLMQHKVQPVLKIILYSIYKKWQKFLKQKF